MRIRSTLGTALAVTGLATLSACGGAAEGSNADGTTLDLVGFSVLEAVNNEAVPAFQETDGGDGVQFSPSYGSSGDQSRAVEAGKAADFVHLSLEPDMTRVVDSGQVDASWADGPTKGIGSQSVVSFVVREGNPKGIEDWDDLTKDGVSVITPNPASSGSAKWNLLAAYGHTIADGGSEKEAQKYVGDLLGNAAALPESARDATTLFESGTGDVLLSYENEAILAIQNGAEFEYLVPDTTLLIENPAAVTKDAPEAAQAWLDFVISPEGQAIYAKYGYRPVVDIDPVEVEGANDPSNPFPEPGTLLTVAEDFEGWEKANTKYFDEESGVITKLLQQSGKG
jgi:sulfate transport system substrate-binding protein